MIGNNLHLSIFFNFLPYHCLKLQLETIFTDIKKNHLAIMSPPVLRLGMFKCRPCLEKPYVVPSASQAKVMARNRFGWSDYSQIFSFLTGKNGEFFYVFLIKKIRYALSLLREKARISGLGNSWIMFHHERTAHICKHHQLHIQPEAASSLKNSENISRAGGVQSLRIAAGGGGEGGKVTALAT
jgi:hypothetical protein